MHASLHCHYVPPPRAPFNVYPHEFSVAHFEILTLSIPLQVFCLYIRVLLLEKNALLTCFSPSNRAILLIDLYCSRNIIILCPIKFGQDRPEGPYYVLSRVVPISAADPIK